MKREHDFLVSKVEAPDEGSQFWTIMLVGGVVFTVVFLAILFTTPAG